MILSVNEVTAFKRKEGRLLKFVFSLMITLSVFNMIFGMDVCSAIDLASSQTEVNSLEVNLTTDSLNKSQETILDYSNSLPDLFEKVEKSVVQITESGSLQSTEPNQSRLGSGFVYDKEGHIVTNFHVVDSSKNDKAFITFLDGASYEGEIIGSDPYSDLAVIKLIDVDKNISSKLVPLVLGNSSTVRIGEKVVAVGNPFGLSGSLSEGIISGLGRLMPVKDQHEPLPKDSGKEVVQNQSPTFSIPDIIQTDAAINPGNSGGPLIDMTGRVIGINTAIFSNTGVYSGIGFAIPSNFISKIIPELIQKGSYEHPYIGINGVDITPEIAKLVGLPEAVGFLVVNVTKDNPADKSGIIGGNQTVQINGIQLKIGGDIITDIDDRTVRKLDDILSYLENYKKIGDNVNLTVLRGSDLVEEVISINLIARPAHDNDLNIPTLGILGLELNAQIAKILNLTQSDGFLVTSIIENSTASKANLRGGYVINDINGSLVELGGDIITRIDDHIVKTHEDIRDYLKTKKIGDTVTITILRDGDFKTLTITLEQMSENQRRLQHSIPGQSSEFPFPSQLLDKFLDSCSKTFSREICNSMTTIR